ncbi:hypothetical protein [Xanthobacter variabilis]|uniref:hypothetical protein n=1 Tax=Xanthobacter variabilis TaxID=3119932 RepID=UPI0037278A90
MNEMPAIDGRTKAARRINAHFLDLMAALPQPVPAGTQMLARRAAHAAWGVEELERDVLAGARHLRHDLNEAIAALAAILRELGLHNSPDATAGIVSGQPGAEAGGATDVGRAVGLSARKAPGEENAETVPTADAPRPHGAHSGRFG